MQSVTRAFDVLFAVAQAGTPPTVGVLARQLDLPRSTTGRMLDTLTACGVVAKTEPSKGYVVTPKLSLAAHANATTATLAGMIGPTLHRLVALTEETSSLHVRMGDLRVCVAEVEGSRGIRWARGPGWSAPLWVGAVGRLLMSGLDSTDLDDVIDRSEFHALASNTVTDESELRRLIDDVCTREWSASESETFQGAAAVAAPVFDPAGRVIAVISLYASADRLDHMKSFATELVSIANAAGAEWNAISAFPPDPIVRHDVQNVS
jgi:DNA-binding IclR family transcriptional regulator